MDSNNVLMPYVREFGMADGAEDRVANSGISPTTTILVDQLDLELLAEHSALTGENEHLDLSDLAERKLAPIVQSLDNLSDKINNDSRFMDNYLSFVKKMSAEGVKYSLKDDARPTEAHLYSEVLFTYAKRSRA